MTDKELKLVQEILDGQGRYKFWDCSRNDTYLCFPNPTAFYLWHYFWTHESDEQKFWQGNDAIVAGTRLALNTVKKWRRWLLENGWLIPAGGTAADMYEKPTAGARNISVLRANDPRPKEERVSDFDSATSSLARPKFDPNVYGSGFDSGFVVDSDSRSDSPSPNSYPGCPAPRVSQLQKQNLENQNQHQPPASPEQAGGDSPLQLKPKASSRVLLSVAQRPKPVPSRTQSAKRKKCAEDGTRYPADFDNWTNFLRCRWLEAHSGSEEAGLARARAEARRQQEAAVVEPKLPFKPIGKISFEIPEGYCIDCDRNPCECEDED